MSETPEEVAQRALRILKEQVRYRLKLFAGTPAGQVVRKAGNEYVKARDSGRDLTPNDFASFCIDIVESITSVEEEEESDNG